MLTESRSTGKSTVVLSVATINWLFFNTLLLYTNLCFSTYVLTQFFHKCSLHDFIKSCTLIIILTSRPVL